MKAEIHPEYGTTTVKCVCGNTWETRSTVGAEMHVDICSACHPFYTGKQKLVDTAGRVERFRKRYAKVEKLKAEQKVAQEAAAAPVAETEVPAAEPKKAEAPVAEAPEAATTDAAADSPAAGESTDNK